MLRVAFILAFATVFCVVGSADPVEGLWRVSANGPLLRIAADNSSTDALNIIWEDGEQLSIVPGTVIGYAVPSPRKGVYDCHTSLVPAGKKKGSKSETHFVIRLLKGANDIAFEPYEQSIQVDVHRILPWWLRRISVKKTDTRPQGLDGARRVGAPPRNLDL